MFVPRSAISKIMRFMPATSMGMYSTVPDSDPADVTGMLKRGFYDGGDDCNPQRTC